MSLLSKRPKDADFSRPTYFTQAATDAATARVAAENRAVAGAAFPEVTHAPGYAQVPVHAEASPAAAQPERRPGAFSRLGTWIGRTVYLLIFVAAIGLAAAASVHAWDLRTRHDADIARIGTLEQQLGSTESELAAAEGQVADGRIELAEAKAALETAKARETRTASDAAAYRDALLAENAGTAAATSGAASTPDATTPEG